MVERPSGTVTFLFTDVEGSTRLWEEHPAEMRVALELHDEILRSSIERWGGYVFSTAGDAFAAAFARPGDAVDAAVSAQRALSAAEWPAAAPIRVRMGLHAGEAQERAGDYFGPAVNRAARIMSAGNGGQVLASAAVAALRGADGLIDLGVHRLKDLTAAEHLWQVGRGSFHPLRTLDIALHNLPIERTALVGRAEQISEIVGLVRRHRLVTLLGIGGSGKTRLAAAVAAEIVEGFADGVWFVDLVPASDGAQVAEAIAAGMGLGLGGSDLGVALGELLDGRDVLVVLDNCEHITNEVADLVDHLLERCEGPRFLATSREPLDLVEERQVQVPPLVVTGDLASPALELFALAAERVGVTIDEGDAAIVAEICSQLDGHPLSVELAAAQLRHLSLVQLAGRLGQRFGLLTRGRRSRGRQSSLLAVLEETWTMLERQEVELLLRLAAFPSGFGVEDVEGVAAGPEVGVVSRTLAGLVDLGLASRTEDGRHRLSETVKLYARQRWAEDPEPGRFAGYHTAWILSVLRQRPVEDWYTSYELAGWAGRHYDDHRAAEDRLVAEGKLDDLVDLLSAMTFAYQMGSGSRASLALARIEGYLRDLDLSDRARGLLNLTAGHVAFVTRRHDWIARGSSAAFEKLDPVADPEHYAQALMHSSWITGIKESGAATSALDRSIELARAAGAHAIADGSLGYKAAWLAAGGRIDDARDVLAELRTRLEGHPFDLGWNNYYVTIVSVEILDDPVAARQAAIDVFDGHAAAFGPTGVAWHWWLNVAMAAGASGDIEVTRSSLTRTTRAVRDTGTDDGLPELLLPLIALAWALDQDDIAQRWLTAFRYCEQPPSSPVSATVFRQFKHRLGLLSANPLEHTTIEDVYAEALQWLDGL